MMTTRIKIETLHTLAFNKLQQAGYPETIAKQVADVLVHADSHGVHSHGVIRVEHYCHRLSQGGMNPDPTMTIEKISSSVAILDGDDGMGHCALIKATEEAITIAKEHAVGFVSIKNTSHCGALSYFAQMAADQGLISISMTQTDTCVAPFGGAEAFWGTNPIAFGFPVENGNPVIIDMATSATAFGKLLHAKETGQSISLGLAIDKDGVETTDPHAATTLLPFGFHKGSGIAMAIDALTGMLMGANFSNHIVRMYDDYDKMRKLASLMIVIDPSKFGGHSFSNMMAQMVSELHQVKPAPGFDKVLAPNEPQTAYLEDCQRNGVPVTTSIYQYLTNH
ncbi:ureidoglycolate dehydrogenase [Marinomonas algicola]|uniref:ureidoglycolate dehydrogenase n=1 Tax=Marinomonas algicola TaxID=2773454 RepID=UPI001749AAAF|nr:ureidoglycolate dehydrogenase [Marinomonas algicola]